MSKQWEKRRKRLYDIIEVGSDYDVYSRTYDFVNASAIILNIVASIMYTFKEWREQYGLALLFVIHVTVAFFAVDYVLRIWTAKFQFRGEKEIRAIGKYVVSTAGIIDLISFLPEYLPFFFPSGGLHLHCLR